MPTLSPGKKFALFDYTGSNGKNDIKEWTLDLEKIQRGKLNAKLDQLQRVGPDLFPHVLTGTDTPGILKIRVKGNVQLRPMLCQGPIHHECEYTLLIGAVERGSCLIPDKADEKALERKETIINDPNRRCPHERVS
jgi:hypothetical protein